MKKTLLLSVATLVALIALPGTSVSAAVAPASAASAAAAAPATDPVSHLSDAKQVWYKKIRDLAVTSLSSSSMKEFRAGEEKLLDIKDPEALGPLVLALSTSNTRWRSSLVKAVVQFAKSGVEPVNKQAVIYLEDLAVADPSSVLRSQARATLLSKDAPRDSSRLKFQLANCPFSEIRDRAADLLADLKDQTARAALINALSTEELRPVAAGDPRLGASACQTNQIVGGLTTPVVTNQRGGGKGQILLPPPTHDTTFSFSPPGGPPATTQMQQVRVNHPGILAALKSLTGQDFGYDKAAWMNWITSGHGDQKSSGQPSANWGFSK